MEASKVNPAEYALIYHVESSHWYFKGKSTILWSLIDCHLRCDRRHRILDVGCGAGNMLEMLQGLGRAYGLDRSPLALSFCRQRRLNDLILADAAAGLPLKAAQFDLVCAFDLLEHLPEERPLLREIRRVLKANGFLFLTVPAFGFLWSEHDEALGHQRRYTAVDLRALLGESGFRIVRLSYYNSFLFPIAYLYRLIRRIFRSFPRRVLSRGACSPQSDFFVRLPTSANQILYSCFKSEALFLRYLNLPLGLALIGVASPRE